MALRWRTYRKENMTITELGAMKKMVDGLTRHQLSAMVNMSVARQEWERIDMLERNRLREMLPSTEELADRAFHLSKMSVDNLVRRRHEKFPGLHFVDRPLKW